MVLLQQTRLDKLAEISHYKFVHNPPCNDSPIASYIKNGQIEVLASISNLEKDTLDLHTPHLKGMKTYKIDVPFEISSIGYQD